MGQASAAREPRVAFSPVSVPKRADIRTTANFRTTLVLLIVVGLLALLVSEQILTGWLAFGERANISRRDINIPEIIAIIGSALWGLLCLRVALGFMLGDAFVSMQAYFDDARSRVAPGVLLSTALLILIGAGSLILAEQIATGWIALGDRFNLSRRDYNWLEIVAVIACALWGLIALRTAYGLYNRERRMWSWSQWVMLLTAVVSFGFFVSGLTDIYKILPRSLSLVDNLPGVIGLVAPALLIFLSASVAYRFLSIDTKTSAYQATRNQLAKSPGAGAIIGFIVIAALFSVSSDLFLEQRSLAGLLATNITRGIVAIGITFLMISGEFDLSVGSVYGAGALVFLLMMTEGLPVAVLAGVPLILIGIGLLSMARGRAPYVIGGIAAFVVAGGLAFTNNTMVITTVIPAAIIALIFAAILGMINGVILIRTGIPSFIVTLGTLLAYRAILLVVVADGRILRYADYRLPPPYIYLPNWLLAAGVFLIAALAAVIGFSLLRSRWLRLREWAAHFRQSTDDFRELRGVTATFSLLFTAALVIAVIILFVTSGIGLLNATPTLETSAFDILNGRVDFAARDVNLRTGVMWWALLVLVFQFVLTQTKYGNHVFAVGGNAGAARAQGINVSRVKVFNFMLCAMLAAFAGIVNVARLANVDPLMGDGLELDVIAASVIGGALLTGGYGSIIGSLLGVLIFGMLQTGLVLVGVDSRSFSGVIGVIIIVAVVINTAVRRIRT